METQFMRYDPNQSNLFTSQKEKLNPRQMRDEVTELTDGSPGLEHWVPCTSPTAYFRAPSKSWDVNTVTDDVLEHCRKRTPPATERKPQRVKPSGTGRSLPPPVPSPTACSPPGKSKALQDLTWRKLQKFLHFLYSQFYAHQTWLFKYSDWPFFTESSWEDSPWGRHVATGEVTLQCTPGGLRWESLCAKAREAEWY